MKKLRTILIAIILSLTTVTCFAANWQIISSSPTGGTYLDKDRILYNQETNSARVWVKNEFLNRGSYCLQEVRFNFNNSSYAFMSDAFVYDMNNRYITSIKCPEINREAPVPENCIMNDTMKATLKFVNEK